MGFRLVSIIGDQAFELNVGQTYVVGRTVTSDIAIFDFTISRQHAEIEVNPTTITVKDLESANGTFINGVRITQGMLAIGDSVTFGKKAFELQTSEIGLRQSGQRVPQGPSPAIVKQVAVIGGAK